ncbi:phosphatase PAP2 family protein [Periweissella ghanensis]|uniref:Phosphatidic acid phosphatase type 2/haloperoxidase domain-containing protein n=1 Tax=Periweissella ghanensis TaxID=467997 RepID=A0ABN8BIT1_9LACO|nr:phosphatase PAP2 family protein [Periweissella ghanensis]MCM0600940.1 phosphatase PAP2 family protein [Periweissella ghanensis]CAH0417642.1 hypothetical protein WGH24286_00054 [Periweissella ghanensis]
MQKTKIKIGISAFIFIVLMLLVVTHHATGIDNWGFSLDHGALLSPNTPWMLEITYMSEPAIWLVMLNLIMLYLFFSAKKQAYALYMGLWLDGAVIIATVIKILVGRHRPLHQLVLDTGYSFPSIHTMTAAICVLMFLALFKTHSSKYRVFQILGLVWVITVAASRVYLRNHYPSDVLGGATLAYLWTNLLWYINQRWLHIIK